MVTELGRMRKFARRIDRLIIKSLGCGSNHESGLKYRLLEIRRAGLQSGQAMGKAEGW